MKILFFSPHSAIWVHAFPEALVAEALSQSGHEIIYITCGRQFKNLCVPMSAHRLTPQAPDTDKERVCGQCDRNKNLIRKDFGFGGYDLASVLDDADHVRTKELLAQTTPTNFLRLSVDGVEVGRAALGTFLLSYKKSSFQFSDTEWGAFCIELRNTLYALFGAKKIIRHERPDRLLVYSSGYSVNLVFCHVAAAHGVAFYYMNAAGNLTDRLRKLVIARGHSLQKRLLDYWPAFRAHAPTAEAMKYSTDGLLEALRGRSAFVYSAARSSSQADLRNFFGIEPRQSVLLATLSSYDELFAAETTGLFPSNYRTPFRGQVDWISSLLEFMRLRSDLFLIVRVHPREFPNKRDSVKSEHAAQLEMVMADLPANVRVNWPSDNLSLYDLAEITDVCLNAWSTAGREMTLLGIPTVIYSPDLVFYPADLNYVGETPDEYFLQIQRARNDGWSAERSRLAYRWLALEELYSRIDISDGYRETEHPSRALPVRIYRTARRMLNPDYRKVADCRRRPRKLAAAPLINRLIEEGHMSILDMLSPDSFPSAGVEQETLQLVDQFRMLMQALYSDPDEPGMPGTLKSRMQSFVRSSVLPAS